MWEKLGNFLFLLLDTKVIAPSKGGRKGYLTANAKDINRLPSRPPVPDRYVTLACSLLFRKIFPPKAEPYKNLLLNSQKLGLLDMESEFRGERKKKQSLVTWFTEKSDTQEKGYAHRKHTITQKRILRVIITISSSPGLYHKALLSFLARRSTLPLAE